MARHTSRSLRARGSDIAVKVRGLLRRVTVVAITARNAWTLQGYKVEGDDDIDERFEELPAFGVAGFQSRPGNFLGQTEVVVGHVGASDDQAVVLGTRDRTLEVALDPDELAITTHAVGTGFKLDKNGKVNIGAPAASFVPTNGVATGITKDSWGVPLFAGGVSGKVFSV